MLHVPAFSAHGNKDGHCITQKGTQPSQTCSGGILVLNTQLFAFCYLLMFFAIGLDKSNPIQPNPYCLFNGFVWLFSSYEL
jgi:hypothetical protein